ncbi:helix-turn-helix domain-containing protein [Streptosporangium canum]|uniref:helix-turn-helix domain-containing protein n=1 Tax=Streptosporangium canum TaxID=324952 RepID=UPI003431203E
MRQHPGESDEDHQPDGHVDEEDPWPARAGGEPPAQQHQAAERSIVRIVSAARECLSGDPNASVDDIAKAAGVGRMTLYGHFGTRAELVEAALVDALRVAP